MAQYLTVIQFSECTDGSYAYLAYHPELYGCMSDGETPEEAEENLSEARAMVREHLREHGVPIPEPITIRSEKYQRIDLEWK